ncbi:MAG: hypothetical protein AAFO03_27105, partial [Bacteroidota bacterium]
MKFFSITMFSVIFILLNDFSSMKGKSVPPIKLELNTNELNEFGLPISSYRSRLYYSLDDGEQIVDTIDLQSNGVLTLEKHDSILSFQYTELSKSIEGSFKILPFYEVDYQKAYDPVTMMV